MKFGQEHFFIFTLWNSIGLGLKFVHLTAQTKKCENCTISYQTCIIALFPSPVERYHVGVLACVREKRWDNVLDKELYYYPNIYRQVHNVLIEFSGYSFYAARI